MSPRPLRDIAGPNRTFARLLALYLLYPPFIAIVFGLFRIPLPSYLFLTVVALVMLLGSTRFSFRIYPHADRQSITAAILILLMLASASYTLSPTAWLDKVTYIVYLIVVPVVMLYAAYFFRRPSPFTLDVAERMLYRHARPLLWITAGFVLLFGSASANGRISLPGIENTIWVARYIGALSVVVCCSAVRKPWRNGLQLATLVVALGLMFLVGSRAPLLALMVVLLLSQYRRAGKSAATLLAVGVASIAALAYVTVGGYVFETGFYSLYDRIDILGKLGAFSFPPAGFGIGSFGILTTGVDYLFYPHNLFAEVFFEQGAIGLALLLILLYFLCRKFQFDVRGYLMLYYFINSMGSGDIPSNNDFFILIFISAIPLARGQQRWRLKSAMPASADNLEP